MFCGNPLAGGKAAGRDRDSAPKHEDGERWDPEKIYSRSRGRMLVLVITAVAIAAIAAAILGVGTPGNPQRSFSAPLGTPGANNLQEMTAILKKAGLNPNGKPYEFGDTVCQMFDSAVLLGEVSTYSLAAVQNGREIGVIHEFDEEKGKLHTISRPGPVFGRLLERLTKDYGKPEFNEEDGYYRWSREGDILVLHYRYEDAVGLDFYGEVKGSSV